jgi:stage III sporulation protein SpoIIIAA
MKLFNMLPKTVKKTLRYINQDASYKQLKEIQKLVNQSVEKRIAEVRE